MVDTFMKKRIIENTKKFLDDGFQEIVIRVYKNGFSIVPTKKCRKDEKSERGKK